MAPFFIYCTFKLVCFQPNISFLRIANTLSLLKVFLIQYVVDTYFELRDIIFLKRVFIHWVISFFLVQLYLLYFWNVTLLFVTSKRFFLHWWVLSNPFSTYSSFLACWLQLTFHVIHKTLCIRRNVLGLIISLYICSLTFAHGLFILLISCCCLQLIRHMSSSS